MTYICYTECATGYRHFACIATVLISFDPRFIDRVIKDTQKVVAFASAQAAELESICSQDGAPELLHMMTTHKNDDVQAYKAEAERLATAEAVVGGVLARSIVYTENIETAVDYTKGTP